MSLSTTNLSIVIGSIFTGAKALTDSNFAVKKLILSVENLDKKRATLKVDSKEYLKASKQIKTLESAIDKINTRKIKIDTIIEGREKFKSSLMEKIAIGATVAAPIKVAIDFESAMADVKKVVNFTNELDFSNFNKELLNLAKTIPLSASELAQIAASGGQLGIAKENLLEFTKTVAKMSTAFDMSASEAGDSIAKLMNVYGLSMSEVKSLGDSINHLSDNSAAKASDIVQTLGRIGGVAKMFGLTSVQAGALASAFIALGKPPEVAATSINALLLKLKTAPKQGKKFQEALEAIGLDATELKAKIDKNAIGGLNEFLNAIKKVDKNKQMDILSDLFGAEYSDDIALLVGGLENYNKALKLTSDATKYQNSMQREFENRSATTANNLQLLKNSISTIAINFGSVVLPALNSVVGVITKLSSGFSTLINIPVLGSGIKIVLALAAGFALTSIAISGVGFVMGYAVTGFLALRNAITIATVGMRIFTGVLMANPIGAVVGGIVLAATLIYTYWEPISKFFSWLWNRVKNIFNSALNYIKTVLSFSPLALVIKAWSGVFSYFSSKLSWLSGAFEKISSIGKSIGSFFGFGNDDKKKKEEIKPKSSLAKTITNSSLALATAGTMALATPAVTPKVAPAVVTPKVKQAVITPKVNPAIVTPKVAPEQKLKIENKKQSTQNSTLNVAVNINNPKVTSKEELQKMHIEVKKAVESALKEAKANEKNRTYKDIA